MQDVGAIQINCFEVSKKFNPLLKKIKNFPEKEKIDIIKKNWEMLSSFGKSFPQMIQLFRYEEFGVTANRIYQLCEKKMGDKAEPSQEELFGMIDDMVTIIDRLLGDKRNIPHVCNCCGSKVMYLPLSNYFKQQQEKYNTIPHTYETMNESEYTCPHCGASDRDRLIISFLEKLNLNKGYHGERLLQIAPAKTIEKWIYRNCTSLRYESTDLYMDDVTFSSDIQDMNQVQDEQYDYIICSHVLEHVKDDRKAMRELHRILKTDGFGIFLVPIALDVDEIDEEWGLSKEENWRRFGQDDHCRLYARQGLIERLKEAGFYVHELGKEYFGEEMFSECGLTDTSVLYVLTKQPGNIEQLVEEKKCKQEEIEPPQPLVSVLMSAYNHEKYVGQAIESVLNQTYRNFEFLVADDASTDSTAQEILKYEDKIDEIHLFEENASVRLFFLSERAKGKYIAIINSDDVWEPDKLQLQVEFLENNPECGACYTECVCINEKEQVVKSNLFLGDNKKKESWMRYFYDNGNCLVHPSMVLKREIYYELTAGEIRIFRQIPDLWMWTKLVQKHEIHIMKRQLVKFRIHENEENKNTSACTTENITRHQNEEMYLWYKVIKEMESSYFKKVFQDILIDVNADTEKEIMCEKLFVLLKNPKSFIRVSAIFYMYDICQDSDIIRILKEKYNFDYRSIYAISGQK